MAPIGSVVLTSRAPIGNAAIAAVPLCTSQGCKTIVPDERVVLPRYLLAAVRVFRTEFERRGNGTTFQEISTANVGQVRVPLPSLDEQALIVRYLDHADLRVGTAIAAKRRVVALLDEAVRSATWGALVACDASTEPLFSHPWMGPVPEAWLRVRLKSLLREFDIRSETGTETLLSLRMRQGLVRAADYSNRPQDPKRLIGYKLVEPDALVVNRMRASIGLLGLASSIGLVSPDYATLRKRPGAPVHLPYLLLLLKSPKAGAVIRAESKGLGTGSAGFLRIYSDRFGVIPVALPPIAEQVRRAEDAGHRTQRLTEAAAAALREIDLLMEFRDSLVADVVTGRRDVRADAERLADVDPDELDAVMSADGATIDDDVEETEE